MEKGVGNKEEGGKKLWEGIYKPTGYIARILNASATG